MEDKPRIVIAGGSGFIGQALSRFFALRKFEIVVLTRGQNERRGGIRYVTWNGKSADDWTSKIDGATAVINLAGRSINCRFTKENRAQILHSRVESTRALASAIAESATPPPVLVQASGIGFYDNSGERVLDESSPIGSDFMAEVCRQWESALANCSLPATRKIILRIGIVLDRGGGALAVLDRLTRAYFGGAAGSGRQFVSWIHLLDLVRIIAAAIERPNLSGIFNATAPNPVTNAELMRELRLALHRPWSPSVPAPMVRLGAWSMGTEGRLALQSFRVRPKRLLDAGFAFQYPHLEDALRELYGLETRAAS